MREAMTIASQRAGIGLRAVAAAPTSFAPCGARQWLLAEFVAAPARIFRALAPRAPLRSRVGYTPSSLTVCFSPPWPVQVGESSASSGEVRRFGHRQRSRCLVVLHDFSHHRLAAALKHGAVFDHELLRAAQTYEVGVDLRHDISSHEVPAA